MPGETEDELTKRIIAVRKIMRERDRCRLELAEFSRADILRDKLKEMGVEVKDQKDGPSGWRFVDGSSNKLKPGTKVPEDAIRPKKRSISEASDVQEPKAKIQKVKSQSESPQKNQQPSANELKPVKATKPEKKKSNSSSQPEQSSSSKICLCCTREYHYMLICAEII